MNESDVTKKRRRIRKTIAVKVDIPADNIATPQTNKELTCINCEFSKFFGRNQDVM